MSPFTLYIIQLAHTDIGYTHPQEQIGLMYLDSYDRVLELCRRTAALPEPERFKWTCETAWQVRHYLTARPEREAEFLHYARAGQVEITASYLHFTDLIDADAYRRSLAWAVEFCRRHGLPLRCATHCDINGWPWAVADILADHEIQFFCSQIHLANATDPLGRRGSVHYQWAREWGAALRPDAPIRIPQAFWWQGPAGRRVLHWLGEHYLLGNVLGISSPRGFHADKTRYFLETDHLTVDDLYLRASREIPRYIARLRHDGYPYTVGLVCTGGFSVDNSPPDRRWCDVIARWNQEHADIRLRTATLSEWFDALCTCDMQSLPTYQAAWPDHWAHGLGSMTARIAQARRTQRRRQDAQALVGLSGSAVAAAYLDTAFESERLSLEHTFSAWSTTARPAAASNDFQEAAKALTFHRAELYLDEAIGAALRSLIPPAEEAPRLYLHCAESQDATRLLHFDAGDLQLDPARQVLVAVDGQCYPFQQTSHPGTAPHFVAALPVGAGLGSVGLVEMPGRIPAADASQQSIAEITTAGWRLRIDPTSGGLASLYDHSAGREWVAHTGHYTFGQLVHEVIVHPLGREAVGEPARLIALDVASSTARQRYVAGPVFERIRLSMEATCRYTPGPVFDAISLQGAAAPVGRVQVTWRCYHALPIVELVIDWDKQWCDRPEAAYVSFPFAAQGGQLALESAGGFFQPGSHASGGQLPGTCSTYYTIQRAARITAADGATLFWLPLDAPLVMTNSIDFDRWESSPWSWNGFLASMPVNHYWHTNYPTSQRGHLRLRYRLISASGPIDNERVIQAALPIEALGWR
jgi:hypothetical protein